MIGGSTFRGKFSQYLVLNPHQLSPQLWQETDRFEYKYFCDCTYG